MNLNFFVKTIYILFFCTALVFCYELFGKDSWKSANLANEGAELVSKKEYKAGLTKLKEAVKEDDTNAAAYFWIGHALFGLNDFVGARDNMLKSIELNPYVDGGYYNWLSTVYTTLGDAENSKKYSELAANPPKKQATQEVEEINEDYHEEMLSIFNQFQERIGNTPTKIDMRLNNAAKKHGEYLFKNHFKEPITLQWHYEEKGKPGFIGKDAIDQGKAFGFSASPGYFVGNTLSGFSEYELFSTPNQFINHMVSTIYHRSLVIGGGFEAIGVYKIKEGKSSMLVYFMSMSHAPDEAKIVFYPYEDQEDVPRTMLPETPDPFPGDHEVGFPITVQLFTKVQDVPVLVKASLKNSKNKDIPFYTLSPASPGTAGTIMKGSKMVCIAAKDPLAQGDTYTVTIKLKNKNGIFFDRAWKFTTQK